MRKKIKNWSQQLSPKIFNGWNYSRAIACCGHLTSKQNALIYTTHIKKVIARHYFFILRSKITEKQFKVRSSQRSEISLDTGHLWCSPVVYGYGNFAILIQSETFSWTPYPIHVLWTPISNPNPKPLTHLNISLHIPLFLFCLMRQNLWYFAFCQMRLAEVVMWQGRYTKRQLLGFWI